MEKEKFEMLNPMRYAAAALIATGGSMHAVGLIKFYVAGQAIPWWMLPVFAFAIVAYPASAALILKNRRAGYFIAFTAPLLGGVLILPGFFFPDSRLLIFIPGTFTDEITVWGFITLISEPVAMAFSAILIREKMWLLKDERNSA